MQTRTRWSNDPAAIEPVGLSTVTWVAGANYLAAGSECVIPNAHLDQESGLKRARTQLLDDFLQNVQSSERVAD